MRKYLYMLLIPFFVLSIRSLQSADIRITISSNPSLPVENMVKDRNPGFEEGLKFWVLPKDIPDGDRIELSNESYEGKHSLYVNSKRGIGVYQVLTDFLSPEIIVPGESYIISCWVKAGEEVNQRGGTYCGAGSSFVIYSSDWKQAKSTNCKTGNTKEKWEKVTGEPVVIPDFGKVYVLNASTSYAKGEAWIDEISVTRAFAELSFTVEGKNVVQVILEDETGNLIFDSGRLPDKTDMFSKTLQVIAAYNYKVKVVDNKGEIHVWEYPER